MKKPPQEWGGFLFEKFLNFSRRFTQTKTQINTDFKNQTAIFKAWVIFVNS